jgi:hypothetical protein
MGGDCEMDQKISGLVSALRKKNIMTFKSCQGHPGDEWLWNFPWVAFLDSSQVDQIREMIKRYNKICSPEARWEVAFSKRVHQGKAVYWLKPVHDYKRSSYLQKEITLLKDYLENC